MTKQISHYQHPNPKLYGTQDTSSRDDHSTTYHLSTHIIGNQITGPVPEIPKGPNGVIVLVDVFFVQVGDIDGTVSTLRVGNGGAASHGFLFWRDGFNGNATLLIFIGNVKISR